MQYQITLPVVATVEKQADELERMLRHAGTLTLQFVTVAGSYKTSRARLTLLTVPDRVAVGAERALAVLVGRADGVRVSAALRRRAEWQVRALLEPNWPEVPPLDGTLLDGWDSVCLTVVYRVGRVRAELVCCAEDAARLAGLRCDGWRVLSSPNAFQWLRALRGRTWRGVPSLAPVPGALLPPEAAHTPPANLPSVVLPAAPVAYDQAFTSETDGLLLGVTPSGSAVRLARRALTLAVCGPAEAQQRAALALIRHGIAAGLGVVVALDRGRVPVEALSGWEPRLRRLDVQAVSVSAAIPWRLIAPDLLAQAIGGPTATLPALPARLGAVFDTLEAGALRVPAVLGLATMPGDDLRRVMAEGGMLLVPQDGDAASTVVAQLLMAYLATPPAIGRGVLLVVEAGLVPPDGLRQQVIQVVLGAREDALLELRAAGEGWTVCGPDGALITELLPDLLSAPSEGAGALVDSIVRDIGEASAGALALAEEDAAASAGGDGWWASGTRADDLAWEDAEPSGGVLPLIADVVASALGDVVDAEPSGDTSLIADVVAPALGGAWEQHTAEPSADAVSLAPTEGEDLVADQDMVLGRLLDALLAATPADEHETLLVAAVLGGQFAEADAAALAWTMDAPQQARAWLWRVVLAEAELDRAVAAWRALQAGVAAPDEALVRAVLAAMDAAEPAAWLAGLGDAVLADVFDEVPEEGTCDPPSSAWPLRDSAAAHEPAVGFVMPAAGNERAAGTAASVLPADEPAVGFLLPAAGNEIAASTGTPMEPEREALVGFVMHAAGNGTAPRGDAALEPEREPAVGFLMPAAGNERAAGTAPSVLLADEPAVGVLMPAAGNERAPSVCGPVLPADEPAAGLVMRAAGNGTAPSAGGPVLPTDEPAVGLLMPAVGNERAAGTVASVLLADEPAVGFLMPAAGNERAAETAASVLLADEPAVGFLTPAAGNERAAGTVASVLLADEPAVGFLMLAAGNESAPSVCGPVLSTGEPAVGFLMPAAGNESAPSAGAVIEPEREPTVGFLMPAAENGTAPRGDAALEPEREPAVGFLMPAAGNESAPRAGTLIEPEQEPAVGVVKTTNGAHELSDAAILAAWQGGESLPQLVARLVAGGVVAAIARARIRAIVAARPPASPTERGAAAPAYAPIAGTQPTLNGATLDDAAIWAAWQAGTKTDDLVYAICGVRGGTKIEMARERIYRVVVPQIVAALECADLVDRLVAGEAVVGDLRYAALMQQLARSPQVPAGHLERTLTQRLIRIWQEG